MATQLFFQDTAADTHFAAQNTKRNGFASGWIPKALATTRGPGVVASQNVLTVAGPTTGVEVTQTQPIEWLSPPVSTDVTIAGTITANIWASESNMSANTSIGVIIDIMRATVSGAESTNTIVNIVQSTYNTELAVTTRGVNNFTTGMTDADYTEQTLNRGDRLRIRIVGDDGATMVTGHTFNASWAGTTAAADGDSYVTFTETFSFESTPTGTVYYFTNTNSAVGAGVPTLRKEMQTTRGGGVQSATRNAPSVWQPPSLLESGGSSIGWFTPALSAFTLSGMIQANLRFSLSSALEAATGRLAIYLFNDPDNTFTLWGSWCIAPTGTDNGALTTSEVARTAYVSGDDLVITAGQYLFFEISFDDTANAEGGAAGTATFYFAGTSAAASGDSYVTLPAVGGPAAYQPRYGFTDHANPGVFMQGIRRAWHRRPSGIFVPDLPGGVVV